MNEEALKRIVKSTIHFYTFTSETQEEMGGGSGCIINFLGHNILLSVAHVTNKDNKIISVDSGKLSANGRIMLYSIGTMNYLEEVTYKDYLKTSEQIEEQLKELVYLPIDFCYKILDKDIDIFQTEIDFGYFKVQPCKKIKINTDLTTIPNENTAYAFFGRIRSKIIPIPDGLELEYHPILYDNLKFIRKIDGHLYEFSTLNSNRKNDDFYGTSGAPIMDENGNLISLIVKGNAKDNKIYGIALNDFRTTLIACIQDE